MKIEYQPIGVFHTAMNPRTGAPRQGILEPENKGTIEIYAHYLEAIRDLEQCEYIVVLYHLHLSTEWHSPVTPPGSSRSFGLFATRSPNRPNPVGFSILKLDGIKGSSIKVSGVDAFDGTPVLDIKPWLPSIDCPSGNSALPLEKEIGL
jgi:tRNA-Thr(GGU) m(6)t(6)A37 methyltransferase TsaA